MIISAIVIGLFLLPSSITDTLAQFPQSSIKDQNIVVSLNANDAIFNANTSEFLGIQKHVADALSSYRGTLLLITGF